MQRHEQLSNIKSRQPIDETTESFRNFIRRFKDSPYTKRAYTSWLGKFVEYSNKEEVILKTGIVVGDNTDKLLFDNNILKIENHVHNYFDYLDDVLHLAPKTRGSYFEGVKRFYKSNKITLDGDVKEYVGGHVNIVANVDMPYTYEEIHKILDKCDERKRVIILLLASTGMRRGAIPELKYGDITRIEQYGIYEITVYKGLNEEYKTFCSLECAQAIDSYLDYRRRCGENITEDSYLIRKQFDYRKQFKNKNNKQDEVISSPTDPPVKHKLSLGTLQATIYNLIYDSGIRNYQDKKTRNGDHHASMAAHAFRKFFQNKCLEGGMDPLYVEVLMGHSIGVTKHYLRPDAIKGENSLLESYVKKAMPKLTISNEERIRLSKLELEIRMKQDEERFKKALQERESRYDTLAAQIEALNKKLGLS